MRANLREATQLVDEAVDLALPDRQPAVSRRGLPFRRGTDVPSRQIPGRPRLASAKLGGRRLSRPFPFTRSTASISDAFCRVYIVPLRLAPWQSRPRTADAPRTGLRSRGTARAPSASRSRSLTSRCCISSDVSRRRHSQSPRRPAASAWNIGSITTGRGARWCGPGPSQHKGPVDEGLAAV